MAVVLLIAAYFLLWNFLDLPEYKELVNVFQDLLRRHGLWIVLVAAFIEGVLLVGNYLPGGLVIFLAVISVGNDFAKIVLIIMLVSLGFVVANVLNYALGRFGWYHLLMRFGMGDQLAKAEQKWKEKSFKVIFLSYWQANLAALTATAAGVLKINFKKFLTEATVSVIFWNAMWALLVYIFREQAVNAITNIYFIFAIVLIWTGYASIKKYRKSKQQVL